MEMMPARNGPARHREGNNDKSSETHVDTRQIKKDTVQISRISQRRYSVSSALVEPQEDDFIDLSAVTRLLEQPEKRAWGFLPRDPWMIATLLVAYIASIVAFWYYYATHQTVIYGDAYAHMLIARRIFDSLTPGITQFGGVWLPLPHIIMLPLIWNNYLWRTGLAGSIPSMICYIIAAAYLFMTVRCLTRDSRASFIGALVFILNPNVLYLQTTPMTEPVLIATLTAASYYFLAWVQEDELYYLILAGGATFLAVLARYDGWFLYATFLVMLVPIGWLKRQSWTQIEGNLLVFGTIGGFGAFLWFIWCWLIFGNPLYFQNGPYSSQAMQQALIQAHILFTYHNWWQAIRYYTIDSMANVGPAIFLLAVLAIVLFIIRKGLTPEMLAGLSFLSPFPFYVIALYGGQAALYVPGAVPTNFPHQLYNARYGVEMVVPCAIFIAVLASHISLGRFRASFQPVLQVLLVGFLIVQTISTSIGGIVSLQDGQFGLDCAHPHPLIIFLAQHYNGGLILEDLYSTKIDALNPEAGINFKNTIYEGSGALWHQALGHPTQVDWVIANPTDPNDVVARTLGLKLATEFTRDVEEPNGLSLYHRNGLAFPTRPIPTYLLTENSRCVNTPLAFALSPTRPLLMAAPPKQKLHRIHGSICCNVT